MYGPRTFVARDDPVVLFLLAVAAVMHKFSIGKIEQDMRKTERKGP